MRTYLAQFGLVFCDTLYAYETIVPSGKEGQLIESDKKMACQSKEKVEALTMTKRLILRKRNLYTFSTTNGCDIILSKFVLI